MIYKINIYSSNLNYDNNTCYVHPNGWAGTDSYGWSSPYTNNIYGDYYVYAHYMQSDGYADDHWHVYDSYGRSSPSHMGAGSAYYVYPDGNVHFDSVTRGSCGRSSPHRVNDYDEFCILWTVTLTIGEFHFPTGFFLYYHKSFLYNIFYYENHQISAQEIKDSFMAWDAFAAYGDTYELRRKLANKLELLIHEPIQIHRKFNSTRIQRKARQLHQAKSIEEKNRKEFEIKSLSSGSYQLNPSTSSHHSYLDDNYVLEKSIHASSVLEDDPVDERSLNRRALYDLYLNTPPWEERT